MNGRPGHLHELFSLNGADDAGIGVLWWKRNMNQQRGAFTNISSLPSLCDQPSTSPTHQLSPSYFPCMSGARECKPRPALQRVCTHLPFSVSFCTDDVCHKCFADWMGPYGEWRCLVNIELFPLVSSETKMSRSSLHYHIIRPPTGCFYFSQELSCLLPHTRGNTLKPSGSGSGIYLYIHLKRGRFAVFLHLPARPPAWSLLCQEESAIWYWWLHNGFHTMSFATKMFVE